MECNKFYTTAVIAHIDHGKTTFIDTILAHGGYISRSMAGDSRILDNRKDEQIRGITMKNSVIRVNEHYFIDTPGHVDFEQLIYSAAIIADNFILVIDINEGITPRTYSLIKFIDPNKTILVLNKIEIDKELSEMEVSHVIERINTLIGDNVFVWDKNNVILCSALLCTGISYDQLKNKGVNDKSNSIKYALKQFWLLNDKIDNKDTKMIVDKYKIKYSDKKSIFSTVFNLDQCVFTILNSFKNITSNNICRLININRNTDKMILLSSFAISTGAIYKENVLFIFKVFNEPIDISDKNTFLYNDQEYTINNMYTFKGEDLIKITKAEPGMIIGICNDFNKNPVISSDRDLNITFKNKNGSFYKTRILLDDYDDKNRLIEFFKTLSLTEQGLKVRKNRFCEFEVSCFGELQFEKICEDLKTSKFEFTLKQFGKNFIEFPTKKAEIQNDLCKILIEPSDNVENEINIKSVTNDGLIKSVISIFCKEGVLIKESINFTKITVETFNNIDFTDIKNTLTDLYNNTLPSIAPFYYSIKLYLLHDYVNTVYTIIQKYYAILQSEQYDDENDFYIIDAFIPQFVLREVISEIRKDCKGSVYIELFEKGYIKINKFDHLIKEIQKDKGILNDEHVVDDATKQRTLKK